MTIPEEGSWETVTQCDEYIQSALPELALTVLMLSVVHMTGRMDIIHDAPLSKLPLYSGDASGGLAAADKQVILDKAFQAVREWRDNGCPAPYYPNDAELQEMMDYVAGVPLDSRYVSMLKEDLGMDGEARAIRGKNPVDANTLDSLPVLIIGAGMSGLLMGFRLKQAGIPFEIVEKNAGVGGTWFENRYPGCRVDVPSYCYSYSFVHDYDWPKQFSPQAELKRYFEHCADLFDLREHISFGTQVERAVYDEEQAAWNVSLRDSHGERQMGARAVVSAVGQLNRPSIPSIKGEETFSGERLHTTQWREDIALEGKRVAVIGTAATAVQLVPELARSVAHLTVFQRTPNWIIIHPEYRRDIKDAEEWALRGLPFYARWYRIMLYSWGVDGNPAHMKIDPAWPQDGLSISAANEERRVRMTQNIRDAVGAENAELLEKVIPKYPPFVKRPNPGDGGYYRALLQDNVELIADGVEEIVAGGIIDASGRFHELDLIVYASGFKAMDFLAPMDVRGLGGVSIKDYWGEDPGAYLGMTVPEFPNFFMLYGPGTNLGFNGNLIFNSECQTRYIGDCIAHQFINDLPAMQVRTDVYNDYCQRMEEALESFSWSHGSTGNWYKNARGKVIANSPWSLLDYWTWTREFNPDDFQVIPATSDSTPQSSRRESRTK